MAAPSPASNTTMRPVISLLLLIHLFFVMIALAGNYAGSSLIAQILDRFAFYTQLLSLDADFTPYHLTHARETDVDHFLEVDRTDGTTLRLPEPGFPGSPHYQRQQRFAYVMAFTAENEAIAGELAQTVGRYVLRHGLGEPRQLRVRRHMLQDWTAVRGGTPEERDPDSEGYYRTPYAANFVVTSDGQVRVLRVEETGQVARPADPAAEEGQ